MRNDERKAGILSPHLRHSPFAVRTRVDIYHTPAVMKLTAGRRYGSYATNINKEDLAMVSMKVVEQQLKDLGLDFRLWGRAEIKELQHILVEGEQIKHCLNGRYEGGFAVLCATDRRLLLIDKKPFYLTLEDVRYDMVSEVDFSHRLLDATVRILTVNKTLRFTSLKNHSLRKLTTYLQARVMEIRQHQSVQVQSPAQNQQTPAYQLGQDLAGVAQLAYTATNPYTRIPLLMRRRVSRFYS